MGGGFEVGGDVEGAVGGFHGAVAGLDEDCADSGGAGAVEIGLPIADEVRAGQVEVQIASGFVDHAGSGFAPVGWEIGMIGTVVGGVDEFRPEELDEPAVHGLILLLRDPAAAEPTLIGNNDQLVAGGFQLGESVLNPTEEGDLGGVAAVLHLMHQSAIAIEKDGGRGRLLHSSKLPSNSSRVTVAVPSFPTTMPLA